MPFAAHKIVIEGVSDAGGLARLIDDGVVRADDVIAVIGKTEGNGGVNDYTRILADQAFRGVLERHGTRTAEEIGEIPMAWSGGTETVASPVTEIAGGKSESAIAGAASRVVARRAAANGRRWVIWLTSGGRRR